MNKFWICSKSETWTNFVFERNLNLNKFRIWTKFEIEQIFILNKFRIWKIWDMNNNTKNCSIFKIVQFQKMFILKIVQTRNLFKVQNCSISKNCSNTKIVQIRKLFHFENLFILENCSNSKFVQTRKLFKLKIVQTQKLFKIEKLFLFWIYSNSKLFEKWKTEKTSRTSEPGKKKNLQKKYKKHRTPR
jgi:hypothetical protein